MGIIWLGYRVGRLAFPLICQWLLDKHGYQKTLRVLIAPMLALRMPSIVLFRVRYPAATVVTKAVEQPIPKIRALKTPNVFVYLTVSLLFGFVTNVPMMFITKFGADLGLIASDCALALSMVFASNMVATYVFGRLSDKIFHQGLMGASAVSASLVHFLCLGFVKTKTTLVMYAILVGFASGGEVILSGKHTS